MKSDLPLLWSPDAPGGTGGFGTPGGPESDAAPKTNPSGTDPAVERLLDLTADHALGQLTPDQVAEMNALLAEHPELPPEEAASLEEAAALLAVAELPCGEAPAGLQQKLAADAKQFFGDASSDASPGSLDFGVSVDKANPRGAMIVAFFGGVLATAAAIVLYFSVLETIFPAPQGPRALYNQFVEVTPDVVEFPWSVNAPGYEEVSGHVAWSESTQSGYLVFSGLPQNDPAESQYQLWIVDPSRDAFPVDGGVFNLQDHRAAGKSTARPGSVFVPIDAKLPVRAPAAFAITLEQPGGVVKSNTPLLVVAPTAATPS